MHDITKMEHELPIATIGFGKFSILSLVVWLSNQPDTIQAAFFNEFDTQLRRTCSLNNGSYNMQISWINDKLSTNARYTLNLLSEL